MYIVTEKTKDHIKLWDGRTKDEWDHPALMTLQGNYPFEIDDRVLLVLRKAETDDPTQGN